jgi:hypothetical protein
LQRVEFDKERSQLEQQRRKLDEHS